ncbi:MAG: hypothetical protein R3Y60_04725 [bacterium]
MAKKGYSGIFGYIGAFCAFFGVFIMGILYLLGLCSVETGSVGETFETVAQWMLLISVTFVGWSFLRSNNLPGPDLLWTILYLVFVVLAFAGTLQF